LSVVALVDVDAKDHDNAEDGGVLERVRGVVVHLGVPQAAGRSERALALDLADHALQDKLVAGQVEL